jgi:hypothetical protein
MRIRAPLLILCLSAVGCAEPGERPPAAPRPLGEPIEIGRTPQRPFMGRFIGVWTARNIAEITSARRRDGDSILTEVVMPRASGQMIEGGAEVAVVSFLVRINCDPVAYEIVRTAALAQDGRILAGHDSPNGDDGVNWSPEGPYTGLARQLCAGGFPEQVEFTSLPEYRAEALKRSGMVIRSSGPPRIIPAN